MTNENYAPYVTRKERISVERFLELSDAQRKDISSIKIIPPSLDSLDFGFIELRHKQQKYNVDGFS